MSSPAKRSSPSTLTEEQAKAELPGILGQIEAARERLKATYEALPEAADPEAELESFRWAVGFHLGDLNQTPTDATLADLIQVLRMTIEWSPWEGEDRTEPREFSRMREAAAKAAWAMWPVLDEFVETVKGIPVPDPPVIAGRTMQANPVGRMKDLLLSRDVEHGINFAVTILEEQGRLLWTDAIGEALTSVEGDSPWVEEGASAAAEEPTS